VKYDSHINKSGTIRIPGGTEKKYHNDRPVVRHYKIIFDRSDILGNPRDGSLSILTCKENTL